MFGWYVVLEFSYSTQSSKKKMGQISRKKHSSKITSLRVGWKRASLSVRRTGAIYGNIIVDEYPADNIHL